MAPSSSSHNLVYDVFPSFSGEDVIRNFLSHLFKKLDQNFITSFRDNEIERSHFIGPEIVQAIRGSRIAMVVLSKGYSLAPWCLDELLEIVKCEIEFGQIVLPIFYGLDPSHVRRQTGEFGKIFQETCKNKTDEVKFQWQEALTHVAGISGYLYENWENEATMIEEIANTVFSKLGTPSQDFDDFVGIEDHIAKMSSMLDLDSGEVRAVGIWGPSGIGKTTIARALFSRLSCQFQRSVFIDKEFVSKTMEIYSGDNLDNYEMELHLKGNFLSEILGREDTEIKHLVGLKHLKVLIIFDGLDDPMVLHALVGRTDWFGWGSRIIMVTTDKHLLRARNMDCIYEVGLPSEELSLKMLCRYAFKNDAPPDGLMNLASEVAFLAGNLPLGLKVLGSYLRGREKEDCLDLLPRLRNGLDEKIGKTMRVSYNSLNDEDIEAIFRHIACLFNGAEINDIKQLLAYSFFNINMGLKILVDKSLIHVRSGTVEMHRLLQEMGKEIVHEQSNEPGEREFLVDWEDICDVFENNTGTNTILGISLDIDEIDELNIHVRAFKTLRNLRFLKIYTKKGILEDGEEEEEEEEEGRFHLQEGFNYLPPKLRLLCWDRYPMSHMPSNFRPINLVRLQMQRSKLEKLWKGVCPLKELKIMDLRGSKNLKEIPDLSMATNLEILQLNDCSSLVELPSSIKHLNKLKKLDMPFCHNLEILPTGINLESLDRLDLSGCSRLKSFPYISINISNLYLDQTAIEEVPWSIKEFCRLSCLHMQKCNNLQYVSLNIYKLKHLKTAEFSYCGALTAASWNDSPSEMAMKTDNIHSKKLVPEASSSLSDDYVPKVQLNLIKCFDFDKEALFRQQPWFFKSMVFSGDEVPSYFTHRTTGTSLINIPLLHTSASQQFFKFKACAVVNSESSSKYVPFEFQVSGWFEDNLGNSFHFGHWPLSIMTAKLGSQLVIFECCFPLNQDNATRAELSYDYLRLDFLTDYSEFQIDGCGIRLPEDGPDLDSRPCNPDILAHVCDGICVTLDDYTPFSATQDEADEAMRHHLMRKSVGDNSDDEGYETAIGEEECRDNSISY